MGHPVSISPAATALHEAERGEGEDGCLQGEGLLPAEAVDQQQRQHGARELGARRPHQLHVVVRFQPAATQVISCTVIDSLYRVVHMVEDTFLLILRYNLWFIIHIKFILWQNFKFDVNKQCSVTIWTTLYTGTNYYAGSGILVYHWMNNHEPCFINRADRKSQVR